MPSYKVEMPREQAEAICNKFIEQIRKLGINNTQIAGSLRRKEIKIGDIDIIVEGDLSLLGQVPQFDIKESGAERVTGIYEGQQLNVFRAEKEYWGSMLWYVTGPKGTTIGYRKKAQGKGWLLNQYGLFNKDGKKIAGDTEEGLYAAFDKPWKAPELRK